MEFEAVANEDGITRYAECAPDLWFPMRVVAWGLAPGLEQVPEAARPLFGTCNVRASFGLFPEALNYGLKAVELSTEFYEDPWQAGSGLSINTETYRSLRLAGIQDEIGNSLGIDTEDLGSHVQRKSFIGEGPFDDTADLYPASRIYARAAVSGRRPQKAVSEQMGVSIATAGRWIRRAMDLGGLPHIMLGGDREDAQEK